MTPQHLINLTNKKAQKYRNLILDPEDLASYLRYKAIIAEREFDGTGEKGRWINWKIGNAVKDYLRANGEETRTGNTKRIKEVSCEEVIENRAIKIPNPYLFFLIDQLPPNQKTVINEHYFGGKDFRQIAEENGNTLKYVWLLHYKAKQNLRNLIEEGNFKWLFQ